MEVEQKVESIHFLGVLRRQLSCRKAMTAKALLHGLHGQLDNLDSFRCRGWRVYQGSEGRDDKGRTQCRLNHQALLPADVAVSKRGIVTIKALSGMPQTSPGNGKLTHCTFWSSPSRAFIDCWRMSGRWDPRCSMDSDCPCRWSAERQDRIALDKGGTGIFRHPNSTPCANAMASE